MGADATFRANPFCGDEDDPTPLGAGRQGLWVFKGFHTLDYSCPIPLLEMISEEALSFSQKSRTTSLS